jgi:hypothetical protein
MSTFSRGDAHSTASFTPSNSQLGRQILGRQIERKKQSDREFAPSAEFMQQRRAAIARMSETSTNYEGFLAVKLSDGKVERLEHQVFYFFVSSTLQFNGKSNALPGNHGLPAPKGRG